MDARRSHSPVSELVRAIAVIVSAVAAATPAAAQMEWNGTQSTSWFNGLNWNPVGPPGGADDVIIDTEIPNFTVIELADAHAARVTIGDTGRGQLLIHNSRTLNSGGNGNIGQQADSHGQVQIEGAGSSWNLGIHTLTVGGSGTGDLSVQNGGSVHAGFLGITNQAGSQGSVVVTGAGSQIVHTANIAVGSGGPAFLDIANGGKVTSGSVGFVGSNTGRGSITVIGTGSSWELAGDLRIGSSGKASEIMISDQAVVSNAHGTIGHLVNRSGKVTVTGVGSQWSNSSSLTVGDEGVGELTIKGGAMVSNVTGGTIAAEEGSQGTVTVSGVGSNWTTGFMTIGVRGTGSLTIDGGAEVVGGIGATIGFASPSVGTVTVSGSGSNWTVSGSLIAADQAGVGTLMIEDGGVVVTASNGIIGNSNQTEGTVLVTGLDSTWDIGGDLTVGRNNFAAANLTIDSGALVSVGGEALVADVLHPGGCDCVLRVDGFLSAAGGTIIHADSRLEGAGMIGGGDVTIAGTVAPGNPVGTLSMRGLILEPTAVLEFELGEPGGAGDRISAGGPGGDLTLDGTLHVADLGGFGEGIYILIEYSGTLIDNTLVIGSLPAGFTATVDTSSAGQVNLVVAQLADGIFDDRFEP